MVLSRKQVLSIFCLLLGILIEMIGLQAVEISLQNYGVLLVFLASIFYCLDDFYDRIVYFAFMMCFFTFLLGRTISYMLLGKEDNYGFSDAIIGHTNLCLTIALVSLLIGYVIAKKGTRRKGKKLDDNIDDDAIYHSIKYQNMRLVSKVFFYATLPFDLLVGFEKFIFVQTMGYAQFYVSYRSRFPYVFVKLGDASIVAFYLFLATFPEKKESIVPVLLFIVHAIVSLGSGKRAMFIVPLTLLIIYFAMRNSINSGESPWITKKHFRVLLALLPFLLIAMFAYNTSRFSTEETAVSDDASFVEKIAGFFENTGFSVNVISFEKYYEDRIPDKLYSIGDTIDYLRENILTQAFFDFPVYQTQTVEKALYGNNFSQTITYLRSEKYYLSGRGYGSSYIAEAYHDFGYMGIVIWSVIYSFVLARMYDFRNKGFAYVTIWLSALHFLLIAPRNMASTFISEIININSWLVIGVVYIIAQVVNEHSIKMNRVKCS